MIDIFLLVVASSAWAAPKLDAQLYQHVANFPTADGSGDIGLAWTLNGSTLELLGTIQVAPGATTAWWGVAFCDNDVVGTPDVDPGEFSRECDYLVVSWVRNCRKVSTCLIVALCALAKRRCQVLRRQRRRDAAQAQH